MNTQKTCLFVIDPQIDFMPGGNLAVAGADRDMERLALMVKKHKMDIDDIEITLDSHHRVHIAHAISWKDQKGNQPKPFTLISADDVKSGKWAAYNPGFQQRYQDYVDSLAKNGRYMLVIWPEHCLIGSRGAAVQPTFFEAMHEWEGRYAVAGKTTKGSNIHTEHYSAVKADVYDSADASTGLNTRLIDLLKQFDQIYIAGEALSHCVANTVRDVAAEFTEEQVKKFTLLEDACSNVDGFTKLGEDFVNEMVGKGMKIAKTTTVF